jgi:RES domain-containing protein
LDLDRALERAEPGPFDGVVHRIYEPDYGFLETIGSYLAGGRWNRKGLYGALYTSLDKGTAIEEVRRGTARINRQLPELGPRDHVITRVKLTRVLNLTDPRFYAALGITQHDMLRDGELCLRIADAARGMGCEGLLVPSAACPGSNLVVYQDRLLEGWKIEEVSRERDVPLA